MVKDDESSESRVIVFEDPLIGIREILADEIDDEVDIASLFISNEGKQYAQHISEQKQFTLNGMLIPILQDLISILLPKISDVFEDEKIASSLKEKVETTSELNPQEKNLLQNLPDWLDLSLKSAQQDFVSGFVTRGEKAAERYLGSMVLSLHSYAEAYLDSIIDLIVKNDKTRGKLLQYCDKLGQRPRVSLADLDEESGNKQEIIVALVKRTLPWNLVKRMRSICKAMDKLGDLDGYISKVSDGKLQDQFQYFCDRRNSIAHGKPSPSLEDYSLSIKPFDLDVLRKTLRDELAKAWAEAPEVLYEIIDIGCEWVKESSIMDYFNLMNQLLRMATLYPAIFDYYVNKMDDNPHRVRMEMRM